MSVDNDLAVLSIDTAMQFVGDPDLPGHERHGCLHLHRWCQWVSQYHPDGVYDGEVGKAAEFNASLPPFLLSEVLKPHLEAGGRGLVHGAQVVGHLRQAVALRLDRGLGATVSAVVPGDEAAARLEASGSAPDR